jgi:hypothetical protein
MTPSNTINRQQFEQLVHLAQDLHDEALKCAEAGAFRAGFVMIGAALEGILLATVLSYEVELRAAGHWHNTKDVLRWDLGELLTVAENAGWLSEHAGGADPVTVGEAARSVKWVRNLIHPGRFLREVAPGSAVVDDERLFSGAYFLLDAAFDVSSTLLDALPDTRNDDRTVPPSVPPTQREKE